MLADPQREAEIALEIKVAKEPWRGILLDAAEYLRAHGHTKKIFSDELGRYCAVGAINMVSQGHNILTYGEACRRLCQRIGMPIVTWNDGPANTAENVIATLDLVARQ